MKNRVGILFLVLVVVVSLVVGCKKREAATDTGPPVVTATAVDTTPTSATVVTATVFTDPDKAFVLDAAASLLAEIAYSKTADTFSTDVAVKALAHLMVNDLTQMNSDLAKLADRHGVTVPTQIDVNIQASNDALAKLKGKVFERTFLKHIVDDHTAMITAFDAESKIVTDPDLKAWVDKNRPILQSHLDKAKELQAKFGK